MTASGLTCELKWYTKAALSGDPQPHLELGEMYLSGEDGLEKEQAIEYFQKAADSGSATAQGKLGWCYRFGDGVKQDLPKALECFKIAAAGGSEEAIASLKAMDAMADASELPAMPEG